MNTLCILISPTPFPPAVSAFCYEAWGIWYNLVADQWGRFADALQLFLPLFVQ